MLRPGDSFPMMPAEFRVIRRCRYFAASILRPMRSRNCMADNDDHMCAFMRYQTIA